MIAARGIPISVRWEKIEHAKYLHWYLAEADVSIRKGWFYHTKQNPKSLGQLLDIYFKSVGRNAVRLLNAPPDRKGLLDEKDVKRLKEFGDSLTAIFKTNLADGAKAVAANTRGNSPKFAVSQTIDPNAKGFWMADDWVMNPTITYTLAAAKPFNVIMLQEEIAQSQRIAQFAVDAWENENGGAWKEIAQGTTVGEKRLLQIPSVTTDKVRVRILQSRVCPTLKKFGLFYMAGQVDAPEITRDKAGNVTLHSADNGAKAAQIRDTTNGSEPTASSPLRPSPFALPQGGVVKARTFANGQVNEVVTENFDICKAKWRVVSADSETPANAAANAIDANTRTIWLSATTKTPRAITIDLSEPLALKGFTYTPRQDGVQDGIIDHYEFYVSADGKRWNKVAAGQFGNIKNDPAKQTVKFEEQKPITARYIRLVAVNEVNGKPIASAAEIGVITR